MSNIKNVFQAFAKRADTSPSTDALVFADMTMTYAHVKRLAITFAIHMARAGVNSRSTVMLRSEDLPVVIATLLAASQLGARVVQHNDGIPLPEGLSITHNFHTEYPALQLLDGSIAITADWSPALTDGAVPDSDDHNDHEPWLYVFTSGTTGNPKFIALSQAMVCDRSNAVADEFVAGKTRFSSLFSYDARPFIARAFASLLNGATIVASHDVAFWQTTGVTLVSGSIAQMVSFFSNLKVSPRLPKAEILGSKPLDSDVRMLLNSFESVHDVFGASEANKVFENVSSLNSDGVVQTRGVMRDSMIEIVDLDGKIRPLGEDGVLRLKNKYMANSYVGDRNASAATFREGWFYSGDIASWGPAGTLKIQNRDDNVINVRGLKIDAFAVDQIFRSVDGIRDAVSFKNPKPNAIDELFVFVVFMETCNRLQATESARFLCREKLGKAFVPRIIREVAGIPRKSDGTSDRKACAEFILKMQ